MTASKQGLSTKFTTSAHKFMDGDSDYFANVYLIAILGYKNAEIMDCWSVWLVLMQLGCLSQNRQQQQSRSRWLTKSP